MSDEPSQPRSVYRRPPSDSSEAAPRHKRSSANILPRRRWPRRTLIGINVLVAAILVGTASAYGYVQWRLNQIHREQIDSLTGNPTGSSAGGGGGGSSSGGGAPFTILIVGSDTRAALSDGSDFGGSSVGSGQRSDTIMLARVVPKTRQIMLLSLPRDLWVNIPGQGQNRINSAFDTSANLLVETIQQDLGIPINHYVEVNFDTFKDISNAVGGVSFYFPTPAKDTYSGFTIGQSGCFSLQGAAALAFVRSRHYEYYENGYWHYEAESDLARIQRQQAFIKKLLTKAEGEYTNPIALNNVIAGVTKNLTVDSKFSNSLILSLARDFRSVDVASMPTLTLPNYAFTTSGGAEVLGIQQPQAAQTIAAFESFGSTTTASTNQKSKSSSTTSTSTSTTTPQTPQVSVAPSSVSIQVVNGSGTSGQAGQMVQTLSSLGYTHTGIGASPGYGHQTTQILYAPDSQAAAQQLAAQIPGGATIASSPALTPTAYNLQVVTGSSYSGGTGTAGSAQSSTSGASTSTGSTTSTTVPGTNSSTYVLPGLPAGATVPNCPA